MTVTQPGILEIVPVYGDWWQREDHNILADGTRKKQLGVRIQPDMWRGYQIFENGQLLAQVQAESEKTQFWRRYYLITIGDQQFRLDTSSTSKDKRERLIDANDQVVVEYSYDQQNQPTALVLRGQPHPLGVGWGDPQRAHRYLNDPAGRPLLRARLRTSGQVSVQMLDVLQPVPTELAVFAVVFADLVAYKKESTEEAAAFTYQPLQQALFDMPELQPGLIELIPVPANRPEYILFVKRDMLLATVMVQRSVIWPLGNIQFEFTAGNVTYRTNTSPAFSNTKEYLADANGTTVAARVSKSSLNAPAFVYGEQLYKIDGEWASGTLRRLYDAADKPILMVVAISSRMVSRVDIYQPVAGGLALAAGVLALMNNDTSDNSGSSG